MANNPGTRTGFSRPPGAGLLRSLTDGQSPTRCSQDNGQIHDQPCNPPCSVPVFPALFALFFLSCLCRLWHRMKRRRRLEQVEQALQTANRKADHHFIQDYLQMLDNLQNVRFTKCST